MKRYIKVFVSIIVLAFTLSILCTSVKAGTITTLDVKQENGKLSVNGTAGTGVYAVAIMVYGEDGTSFITMKTTSVDNSSNYADSINLATGNYVVKVADYNGGDTISKSVTVNKENKATETNNEEKKVEDKNETEKKGSASNPKTGDIIMIFVAVFALSTVGFFVTIKKRK